MKTEAFGQSLREALGAVPDPRSRHGRRHPLSAILGLSVAAIASGAQSLYAIAQWGRLQDEPTLRALGFTRDRSPTVSTLHEVFKVLDHAALEAALAAWAQQRGRGGDPLIALDGKALRGSQGRTGGVGVQVVAAYAVGAGRVLAQSGGRER